jgi:hypothetical protein
MHCLHRFYVSKISDFPQFTSLERIGNSLDIKRRQPRELLRFTFLERLKKEQFWHKMAPAERLLPSTSFVMYNYFHLLVIHRLRQICILLYRTKMVFPVWQSQQMKDNWQCPMVGETVNSTPCRLVFSWTVMNSVKWFYITVLSAVTIISQWSWYCQY